MNRRLDSHRVFIGTVLAVLVVLLGLVLPDLWTPDPAVPTLAHRRESVWEFPPIRQAATLVRPEAWREIAPTPGPPSAQFFTAPMPGRGAGAQAGGALPPPPPPPATKKIELVYQGYIADSQGRLQAFIKNGDSLVIATQGAKVVADFVASEIRTDGLTVVNAAGKTNDLVFNKKSVLEIPAK